MKRFLELQLMRDWQPRSRPTIPPHPNLIVGEPAATFTVLTPGAAAEGMEHMQVALEGATRALEMWAVFRVALTIEGVSFGPPRPGMVYLSASDIPTSIVHFPIMAGDRNKMFRGHHTLLMRVVLL